jgi:anti-sigma regulatory factor (Ser/Thr protein kinase)/DNA-binding transcriptional ArsR family regulator
MVKVRKRGEQIRRFILETIEKNPSEAVHLTTKKFKISRQAVNKHIKLLVDQGSISVKGSTKSRVYSLNKQQIQDKVYRLEDKLEEDVVWRNDVLPLLSQYPENALNIWHYCFTEMFNNAIDHSSGENIVVRVSKTAINTNIIVYDNGEGIFKKIQRELELLDERHAILELSKGKVTTDPKNHTGEGIFFSSRMMDNFTILSGGTHYSHHEREAEGWIFENQVYHSGTGIFMTLNNNTSKTIKLIFDEFTTKDDFGFTKTIVPVNLLQYGDEALVSRSQAKRLLTRIDRFKTVILDFKDIKIVGQAFTDEIFRVFKKKNPGTQIYYINANSEIEDMIIHAILKD